MYESGTLTEANPERARAKKGPEEGENERYQEL